MVADIDNAIRQKITFAYGYRVTYDGSFKNLKEVTSRMAIVVPIALIIIFLLLYVALKSITEALMIYIAVPLATIGGVIALALRGMPFSISAGVGFIVLSGVAVLNGLVLINRFNSLKTEGVNNVARRIYRGTQGTSATDHAHRRCRHARLPAHGCQWIGRRGGAAPVGHCGHRRALYLDPAHTRHAPGAVCDRGESDEEKESVDTY